MPLMSLSYKNGEIEAKRRGGTSGFNSANEQIFVLTLFVTSVFVVMNLRQKSQKRVLGGISGASDEMAPKTSQKF